MDICVLRGSANNAMHLRRVLRLPHTRELRVAMSSCPRATTALRKLGWASAGAVIALQTFALACGQVLEEPTEQVDGGRTHAADVGVDGGTSPDASQAHRDAGIGSDATIPVYDAGCGGSGCPVCMRIGSYGNCATRSPLPGGGCMPSEGGWVSVYCGVLVTQQCTYDEADALASVTCEPP